MKQIFQIPNNCKTVTVEQFGDKIIATFEAIYEPKDGDFVTTYFQEDKPHSYCTFVKRGNSEGVNTPTYFGIGPRGIVSYEQEFGNLNEAFVTRPATATERQQLLSALEKESKRWNPDLKRVEPIRWRAKGDELFYYLIIAAGTVSVNSTTDEYENFCNSNYNTGNYCKTRDEAEQFAAKVRELFKSRTL